MDESDVMIDKVEKKMSTEKASNSSSVSSHLAGRRRDSAVVVASVALNKLTKSTSHHVKSSTGSSSMITGGVCSDKDFKKDKDDLKKLRYAHLQSSSDDDECDSIKDIKSGHKCNTEGNIFRHSNTSPLKASRNKVSKVFFHHYHKKDNNVPHPTVINNQYVQEIDEVNLVSKNKSSSSQGDKKTEKRNSDSTSQKNMSSLWSSRGVEDSSVFGVPLELAVQKNKSHDGVLLPVIVRKCIDYVELHGLMQEGIYRSSSLSHTQKSKVSKLKSALNSRFNATLTLNPSTFDVSVVACVFKQYLRELPDINMFGGGSREAICRLEDVLHSRRERTQHHSSKQSKKNLPTDDGHPQMSIVERIKTILKSTSPPNQTLIYYIFTHIGHLVERDRFNRMSRANASVVFAPTLKLSHPVFDMIMEHHEALFGSFTIKPYVPPLTMPSSKISAAFCEMKSQDASPSSNLSSLLLLYNSRESIEEELSKQDSLLSDLHSQIAGGRGSKKCEEQIWEQQLIVTQLKRKLRSIDKGNVKDEDLASTVGLSIVSTKNVSNNSNSDDLIHVDKDSSRLKVYLPYDSESINFDLQNATSGTHESGTSPGPDSVKNQIQDKKEKEDESRIHVEQSSSSGNAIVATEEKEEDEVRDTGCEQKIIQDSSSQVDQKLELVKSIITKSSVLECDGADSGDNDEQKTAENTSENIHFPSETSCKEKGKTLSTSSSSGSESKLSSSSVAKEVKTGENSIPLLPPPPSQGPTKLRIAGVGHFLRPTKVEQSLLIGRDKVGLPYDDQNHNAVTFGTKNVEGCGNEGDSIISKMVGPSTKNKSGKAKCHSLPRNLICTSTSSFPNEWDIKNDQHSFRDMLNLYQHLQYKNDELNILAVELHRKKEFELSQIQELKEELKSMETLYRYKTCSVDSSEDDDDECSMEDNEIQGGVCKKVESNVLKCLQREHLQLVKNKVELFDKLQRERMACVDLRVKIRMLTKTN